MSNYTKSTNFATKDNLPTGDPLKIVKGTEIDTEFNNIATAISTKTDNASAAITGGSITGITDLAIADGGTGASTATAAINNLLPSQTSNANKYLQTDGTNVSWDAVSLSTSDITGTLPIANGGTGTTSTTFVNLASNVTGTLPVANGGTGVTSSTGTGNNVLSDSPTLVTPALGTPSSAVLTNATGLPISTGVSGLGTGVATALAINTPNTGAIVVNGGALGTPSSGTVTNLTGTASININGTVGNTTAYSGAFTTLTTSSTVTINGGTANGVAYLNGSKVLTTGSVIKFDGTNFTSDRSSSTVYSGTNQATWANGIVLNNSATPATGIFDSIYFSNNANMINVFGVAQNASGYGDFVWAGYAGTYTEWMKLTSSGLTLTSNPTLSGGTANGVTYLNGSKQLVSGSALTFDGTNFGVGSNAPGQKFVVNGASGVAMQLENSSDSNRGGRFVASGSAASGTFAVNTTSSGYALTFGIDSNEQMRLTSTGLGIGTSSPQKKLVVSNAGAVGMEWSPTDYTGNMRQLAYNRSTSAYVALRTEASQHEWYIGGSESMRLDSAGNLGLGVTPSAWASNYRAFQMGSIGRSLAQTGSGAGDLTLAFNAIYSSANSRWDYAYTGDSAVRYSQTGSGVHAWYTAASGTAGNAISFTQAATLTAAGDFLVGSTSGNDGRLKVDGTGNANNCAVWAKNSAGSTSGTYVCWNAATTGNNQFIDFYTETSATSRGSISYNRAVGLVAYNTTSDYRAKDISGPVTDSGSLIDSVPVYMGKMKGATQERPMFIAHETPAYAHTGEKDAVDADGNPVYQQMDPSALIPVMWAEIQSLRQRVAQLETN